MELIATTVVNWLAISSMYILVALGFAFLVNILGILNLAHGVMYMMGGYIAYQLAVVWGINVWWALVVSVGIVAAFGVVLERYCFRPLKDDMNRVLVICIAISVILQTSVNLAIGISVQKVPTFADGSINLGLTMVSAERVVTFAIGAALLAATLLFINKTKTGKQMMAVGQNRVGAILVGIHEHRITSLATVIACGLAAVAGCLMAAYLNLNAFMGDYILLKAIVIVILGGLGSIGGVFFSGLVLGALDATVPVFISGAGSEAITLGLIVLILLVRPQGFFGRELQLEERHGHIVSEASSRGRVSPGKIIGILCIIAFLLIVPLLVHKVYLIHVFILTLIYMIATSSLRLITTSGQMPLAHAAFMGIGAYAAAIPAKWLGWPVYVTIPLGGIVASAIGMLIGYPFARLRALYYAMVSLFFGTGILYFIFTFGIWTGSYSGLSGVTPIFMASKVYYYYFFLGVTAICLALLYRFEFSRIGISLKAVSQSYLLASSVGIPEASYRILALAFGSFFVGIAGALYAHYNLTISYTSFNLNATLWLFMYCLIGGLNSFVGPIIGTALLVVVPEIFRGLKQYVPYISAIILIIVVYGMPDGLVGIPEMIRSRIRRSREAALKSALGVEETTPVS
jgi:branched-chain amino acid transport system permease protein